MDVIAKNDAVFVVMHTSAHPKIMQDKLDYENMISDIYKYIYKQSKMAKSKGINKVFVDPGIGFGKRIEDNYSIINRLEDFKCLGFPILIGLSRKSFLGKTLNLEITQRDEATAIAETLALVNGAKIIRTHNVKFGKQVKDIYKLTTNKRDV
jgi:dihydropteroate synthase